MFSLPDFESYQFVKIYICMEEIIYIWGGKVTIVLCLSLNTIRQRKYNLSTENSICRQTYSPENTAVKLKKKSHSNFSET